MERKWVYAIGLLVLAAGVVYFSGSQSGIPVQFREYDQVWSGSPYPNSQSPFLPLWEFNRFYSEGHYGLYYYKGSWYFLDVNSDGFIESVPADGISFKPEDVFGDYQYLYMPGGYIRVAAFPDGDPVIAYNRDGFGTYRVVSFDRGYLYTFKGNRSCDISFVDGNAEDVWYACVVGRGPSWDHNAHVTLAHYVWDGSTYQRVGIYDVYDESRGDTGIDALDWEYLVSGLFPVRDSMTGKEYFLLAFGANTSPKREVLMLVDPEDGSLVSWAYSSAIIYGQGYLLPSDHNTYYLVGKKSLQEVNVFDGNVYDSVLDSRGEWLSPEGAVLMVPLYEYNGYVSLWGYPYQGGSNYVLLWEFEYNAVTGLWKYVGSYSYFSHCSNVSSFAAYLRTPDEFVILVAPHDGDSTNSYELIADVNYPVGFSGPVFKPRVVSLESQQGGSGSGQSGTGSGSTGTVVSSSPQRSVSQPSESSESVPVQQASPVRGVPGSVIVALVVAVLVLGFILSSRR